MILLQFIDGTRYLQPSKKNKHCPQPPHFCCHTILFQQLYNRFNLNDAKKGSHIRKYETLAPWNERNFTSTFVFSVHPMRHSSASVDGKWITKKWEEKFFVQLSNKCNEFEICRYFCSVGRSADVKSSCEVYKSRHTHTNMPEYESGMKVARKYHRTKKKQKNPDSLCVFSAQLSHCAVGKNHMLREKAHVFTGISSS